MLSDPSALISSLSRRPPNHHDHRHRRIVSLGYFLRSVFCFLSYFFFFFFLPFFFPLFLFSTPAFPYTYFPILSLSFYLRFGRLA